MAHSVELLLDAHTDAAIRAAWGVLAEGGLPSQQHVTSATNRPHVTLIAASEIDAAVDAALRDLAPKLPLECVVGAPLLFSGPLQFPGPQRTLARLIVPSAALLDLHAEVYRLCRDRLRAEPFAHCRPGHWTPHVTLGRRLGPEDVGPALALTEDGSGDLSGRFTGLRRWDGDRRVDHLLVGADGELH